MNPRISFLATIVGLNEELWSQSQIEKHSVIKAQEDAIAKGAQDVGIVLLVFVSKAIPSTTIYIRFAGCVATAP